MKRREAWNPLLRSVHESEKINAVSEGAEVLYYRLIAASDDAGRFYGDPQWVLAKLFTARMVAGQLDAKVVDRRLSELEKVGLLRRYDIGLARYIELIDAFKIFRKDVKPQVQFPGPLPESVTDAARARDESVTGPLRVRPESGPLSPSPEPSPDPKPLAPNGALADPGGPAVVAPSANGKKGNDYSPAFETWWLVYPVKVKKWATYKAWMQARDGLALHPGCSRPEAVARLQNAVEAFSASVVGRSDRCPHPTTWLNQGRYDDDRSEWDRVRYEDKPKGATVVPIPRLRRPSNDAG